MTTNTDPVRAREILAHVIATEEAKGYAGRFGKDQKHVPEWAALEAIAAALASAPQSAPAGVDEMQRRLDREESDRARTIDQRDAAEDALGRMFQAVTGWPAKWSSVWDYADAIEEVEEHVAALAQQPAAPVLAKHQPCGCVICTCEDEQQCQGCGAKHCGNRADHPPYVGQQPAAPSGEAVATVIGYDPWSRVAVDWHRNDLPPGTKLYAAPPAARAGVDSEVRLPAKTLLVSACRAGRRSFTADAIEDGGEPAIPFEVAVSALDAALAAQQQEPTT